MAERVHRHLARQQVQRLANVDVSRAEQRLAHGLAEVLDTIFHGEARALEEDPPSQRQPVAVDAAAGDADDAVPRPHQGPRIDRFECDPAHGRCRQIEPRARHRALDYVAHGGDLAARDGDTRQPRTLGEALLQGLRASRAPRFSTAM